MSTLDKWFIKQTSRGDWAVRGNKPSLPTVIERTREAAQQTCDEMNKMARERTAPDDATTDTAIGAAHE